MPRRSHSDTNPSRNSVDRLGNVNGDGLDGRAVSRVVKEYVAAIGLDPADFFGPYRCLLVVKGILGRDPVRGTGLPLVPYLSDMRGRAGTD